MVATQIHVALNCECSNFHRTQAETTSKLNLSKYPKGSNNKYFSEFL